MMQTLMEVWINLLYKEIVLNSGKVTGMSGTDKLGCMSQYLTCDVVGIPC